MFEIKKFIMLLILLGLHITDIQAEENCQADDAIKIRGMTLRLENDLFTNTDQNYTSGVAITAVSRDMGDKLRVECLPLPLRLHALLIKNLTPNFWNTEGTTSTHNVVLKIGQSIFTPRDPSSNVLILTDRPYAGLLYVGMSWNQRRNFPQENLEMLDTREITLGVIGPWSFAKQSQNVVHETIGVDRFQGWGNQLKNEPAIQLAMDKKFKKYQSDGGAIGPGFSADMIRSLGVRLGNIETSASLAIEGRMGWNLPNDFGSYPIRPGAENRPPSSSSIHNQTNPPRSGVHFFSMLETKLVAHDFSLDGNLFRSAHQVTRRPWVASGALGLSLQTIIRKHGYKFALMRVYRSREFEEQDTYHAYGSIALSVEF